MKTLGKLIAIAGILVTALFLSSVEAYSESAVFRIEDCFDDTVVYSSCCTGDFCYECYEICHDQDYGGEALYFGAPFCEVPGKKSYWRWALSIPTDSTIVEAHVRLKAAGPDWYDRWAWPMSA